MASELISAKLPSLQLAPHHVLVRVRFAPKAEIGHSRPAHLSLDTFCKGRPLRLPGGNTHSVGNTPSIFAGNKKNRQDEARRYAVQHILRGVCWLHTTKSACEARPKPSEAILGGVVWLHLGEKPANVNNLCFRFAEFPPNADSVDAVDKVEGVFHQRDDGVTGRRVVDKDSRPHHDRRDIDQKP